MDIINSLIFHCFHNPLAASTKEKPIDPYLCYQPAQKPCACSMVPHSFSRWGGSLVSAARRVAGGVRSSQEASPSYLWKHQDGEQGGHCVHHKHSCQ